MTVFFVTHPEVEVDPAVPVPEWGLSEDGWRRVDALLQLPWVGGLTRVVSSAERKARLTGESLAAAVGVELIIDEGLGENDRSSTGFLPPRQFEATADAFFAHPDDSVRGWETARHAQERVVVAATRAVAGATGDAAIVAHGGVGTLLLCHLLGRPIDRSLDQPGQGSWYAYDPVAATVDDHWQRILDR